jgi:uncharacterized membrane protein YfcA
VTPTAVAVLIATSFLTSALSAVVGMGGGIALLAVMASLLPAPVVVPLHGVVQLFSNGTRALVMCRHINRKIFALYMIPSIAGVLIGARLYVGSELPWFRPAIGVFILAYLVTLRVQPRVGRFPLAWYAPLGFVVGACAALIGATGPLIAPFFLRDDLGPREIVANKAAIQITTHAAKIPAFFLAGFGYREHADLLTPLVLTAILGTLAGGKVLEQLSPVAFRRLFVTALIAVAVHLIFFSNR